VRSEPLRGTVFLDRDGTINRKAPEGDYVKRVEEFALLPTAAEAIRALNEARRRVIVVTNQRGIALGRMTERDLRAVHEHMRARLAAQGATVDAIYHCPHDRGACDCRKPRVGMFVRAAQDHPGLRLRECAIVGDSEADMAAGATAGMLRVLVARGDGEDGVATAVHHRAPTLLEGVRWLIEATA
jgi:D-glycero-D-manno-heptose 1,7-bisphosphate phosphatase